MTRLTLRIDFDGGQALGPGKVGLLEAVAETGSISAAARSIGMSYRRAWLLLDALNQTFSQAVTQAFNGGQGGGGAKLTAFGVTLVQEYRNMEKDAHAALAASLARLDGALAPHEACPGTSPRHPGNEPAPASGGVPRP